MFSYINKILMFYTTVCSKYFFKNTLLTSLNKLVLTYLENIKNLTLHWYINLITNIIDVFRNISSLR